MAKTRQFDNDLYYHIYNRGVDKRKIFLDSYDYGRFIESLRMFNQVNPVGSLYHAKKQRGFGAGFGNLSKVSETFHPKLVSIIAYCVNPNHFHLLVKQQTDNGIAQYMKRVGIGYANYFNEKYKHSGYVWQSTYKAKEISSTYGLLKVSIYVNANAEIHGIARKEQWPWSSFPEYAFGQRGICGIAPVYNEINQTAYLQLAEDLIPDIKRIKHEVLEKSGLE